MPNNSNRNKILQVTKDLLEEIKEKSKIRNIAQDYNKFHQYKVVELGGPVDLTTAMNFIHGNTSCIFYRGPHNEVFVYVQHVANSSDIIFHEVHVVASPLFPKEVFLLDEIQACISDNTLLHSSTNKKYIVESFVNHIVRASQNGEPKPLSEDKIALVVPVSFPSILDEVLKKDTNKETPSYTLLKQIRSQLP